jgi:hypothetical protein
MHETLKGHIFLRNMFFFKKKKHIHHRKRHIFERKKGEIGYEKRTHDKRPDAHQASASVVDRVV